MKKEHLKHLMIPGGILFGYSVPRNSELLISQWSNCDKIMAITGIILIIISFYYTFKK
jgi:hypothetical protein